MLSPEILPNPEPTRRLTQPGPVHPVRVESASAPALSDRFALEPGLSLIDAIARPLAALNLRSAAVDLDGMVLGPMRFVMPTYSKTPEHVAYYSETYARTGPVRIDRATATFGFRDGAPFLHCHALWRDADGRERGGHILAPETLVMAASEARAVGTDRIAMLSRFDPETNFTLFGAERVLDGDGDLVVARIRPNEDLVEAIEAVAARHDLRDARVLSIIGSTVGARFEDGRRVDEIPTEILGLDGHVRRGANGGHELSLDLALIDAAGHVLRGRLARGENPVLICVELFLREAVASTPNRGDLR